MLVDYEVLMELDQDRVSQVLDIEIPYNRDLQKL